MKPRYFRSLRLAAALTLISVAGAQAQVSDLNLSIGESLNAIESITGEAIERELDPHRSREKEIGGWAGISSFATGRVASTDRDSTKSEDNGLFFRTPTTDITELSAVLGVSYRFTSPDGQVFYSAAGHFGYANVDIDVGKAVIGALVGTDLGTIENNSIFFGGTFTAATGNIYGSLSGSYLVGETDIDILDGPAPGAPLIRSYDTDGFIIEAATGATWPIALGEAPVFFNVEFGFQRSSSQGDKYEANGLLLQNDLESATISGAVGLYGQSMLGGTPIRPYARLTVSNDFLYTSEARFFPLGGGQQIGEIQDLPEATRTKGAIGFDMPLGAVMLTAGLYGEKSKDFDQYGGKLGLRYEFK